MSSFLDDIIKFNASFNNNFTEAEFGYYTYDNLRAEYYEGNSITITKDCEELYECLKNHKFKRIVATKSWFDNHQFTYEKDELYIMKSSCYESFECYEGCSITELNEELFAKYYKFCEKMQVDEYEYFFNPPVIEEVNSKRLKIYLILRNEEIIGSFEVLENVVFEEVILDPSYRKRGIMRNYLNFIANKPMYLVCSKDVVDFYEKSGFSVIKQFDQYVKIVDDSRILF